MILKEKFNHYLIKYPKLKQFIKFCIVGGTSAAIHFLVLYYSTERLNLWYVYSNALGFIISATFNFTTNKLWTFRNKDQGVQVVKQVVKFSLVVATGLVINTLIIYALTEWLGFDYRISWVFATGVITFWNFGFNRFWTFKAIEVRDSDFA